jgi:hypothetical protein
MSMKIGIAFITSLITTGFCFLARPAQASWDQLPGCAKDIGVGGNIAGWILTPWVIGCSPVSGGYEIFGWQHLQLSDEPGPWKKINGGATRIAVQPDGTPWIVNSIGKIYKRDLSSGAWQNIPGCAKDIGVGNNSTAWVIGCSPVSGGYEIFRLSGSTWEKVNGGATRIAVQPDGTPWIVNSIGKIYKRNLSSGTWQNIPGCANDIGVGGNSTAWVIGCSPVSGGYEIFRLSDSIWEKVSGGATRIAVKPDGTPWIVNSIGKIYRWY